MRPLSRILAAVVLVSTCFSVIWALQPLVSMSHFFWAKCLILADLLRDWTDSAVSSTLSAEHKIISSFIIYVSVRYLSSFMCGPNFTTFIFRHVLCTRVKTLFPALKRLAWHFNSVLKHFIIISLSFFIFLSHVKPSLKPQRTELSKITSFTLSSRTAAWTTGTAVLELSWRHLVFSQLWAHLPLAYSWTFRAVWHHYQQNLFNTSATLLY